MTINIFEYVLVAATILGSFAVGWRCGTNAGIEEGIEMAAIAYEKAGYRLDETGERFDGISREEKNKRG